MIEPQQGGPHVEGQAPDPEEAGVDERGTAMEHAYIVSLMSVIVLLTLDLSTWLSARSRRGSSRRGAHGFRYSSGG